MSSLDSLNQPQEELRPTLISFGIKLNIPTRITEEDIKDLFRTIRQSTGPMFNSLGSSESKDIFLIKGSIDKRVILIGKDFAQYEEPKKLSTVSFNSVSQHIYDFFTQRLNVPLVDIKLIGKIYKYEIVSSAITANTIANTLHLADTFPVSRIAFHVTYAYGTMNVHLNVTSNSENDEEPSATAIIDINNKDQLKGIGIDTFERVIAFADDFNRSSFIDLLRKIGLQ